jgi:imidazolonepropionase-like amidohydrolase
MRNLVGFFRRSFVIAVPVILIAMTTVSPSFAERPRIYAIEGARLITEPGQQIDSGTIVIRDGLIEAVGATVTIPPDAVVIDGSGLWVYPGLIDPAIDLALEEGGSTPAQAAGRPARSGSGQAPRPGAVHALSMVHPEHRASDRLLPFDGSRKRQLERYRELGFTTGLVMPTAGIFSGSSSLVLLLDETPVPEMILRDNVAQHLSFKWGRYGQGYPTSLFGAIATIRQVVLDAQRQAVWQDRYEADPTGMERPETVAAYEALADAVAGNQPVVISADSPYDVLLADRLSDELGLRAVISGSGHEWEIADQVAATERAMILPIAFPKKPKVGDENEALDVTLKEMRRYLEAPAAAARLHDAGVIFALTTNGLTTLTDFKKNIGKMIDAGLAEDVALASLTTVPAALLQADRVTGTLEAGKIANLVVLDGPIFGSETKTKQVFVDGHEYRMEEKKKPKGGDPNATVDPRGEWSVVFEFPGRSIDRKWVIEGGGSSLSGSAETRSGTTTFEDVRLLGNMLTVVFPGEGGRGATEITVVISGESFEGTAEFGPRSVTLTGTRTSGPEGGAQ